MTQTKPWETALPDVDRSPPPVDMEAFALSEVYTSLIHLGMVTNARSQQLAIGSSEAGHPCDRRLAYRLHGVPPTNLRDTMRLLSGSEAHAELAGIFTRLGQRSGRFLVEQPVIYKTIPGQVDLYDRLNGTVIDFKTTTLKRLRQIRTEGPPRAYQVQLMLYAAGLRELGEDPRRVALLYLAIDGELTDAFCWQRPVDITLADDATERLARLAGVRPEDAQAVPDRLCPWCAHFRPGSVDLATGCPGPQQSTEDK